VFTRGARGAAIALTVVVALGTLSTPLQAWGRQGHMLVAMLAANHLTPVARRNVQRLLGEESLADVAVWADEYLLGNNQTSYWHYVNIPPDAASYDRDRDCPRQPGVAAGARGDIWRDCVIDRIRYNEERVADATLDRADRAVALKFLVHFVGDLHQPFHATAVARGGNGIRVRVFGSDACGGTPDRPIPCNLHSVWDTQLIAHHGLDDRGYLALLEQEVTRSSMLTRPVGTPAEWAMESLALSNAAMLPEGGEANEAYYRAQIPVIDGRLALAGVRLAALINRSLAVDNVR
jgi:hypothetical protein